ncbi:MAG: AsmA-like C-terminal domain-containing protein [Hyphomicrobiaceae bacterium]|nr:AsmA-like C-terminal domain-containing protein [Hyphomicrobiaceae bacterium]
MTSSEHFDDGVGAEPAGEADARPTRPWARTRKGMRIGLYVLLVPVVLLALLYVVLLITPIKIPFVAEAARNVAAQSMGDNLDLEMGDTFLALERGAPVLQFAPVTITDRNTAGEVKMDALEVGISPLNLLQGQPSAVITMVRPRLQVIQDLLGPRLGKFEVHEGAPGELPTVYITEGDRQTPSIGITSQGLDVRDTTTDQPTVQFRSDHDWLVYNLISGERGLKEVSDNAMQGLFSRLVVRDATLDMHDVVYGVVRTFSNMGLRMTADAKTGEVRGTFSADFGGQTMTGTVSWDEDQYHHSEMDAEIQGVDFASFAPFVDDPQSMTALRGGAYIRSQVRYDRTGDQPILVGGTFNIDISGMRMRLGDQQYPVDQGVMHLEWDAIKSQFTLLPSHLKVGSVESDLKGVFVMGLDKTFGPNVRITVNASDLRLDADNTINPGAPIDEVLFVGWNAPLYGAMGIEQLVMKRGDMRFAAEGRADLLRSGPGLQMSAGMENASVDDLVHLWPSLAGGSLRDWFAKSILGGTIKSAQMNVNFPVGTLPSEQNGYAVPDGSLSLDMVAENLEFRPTDSFDPILAEGDTTLRMRDGNLAIHFGDAAIKTNDGDISVRNAGFDWAPATNNANSFFSFSGNVDAPVAAVISLARDTVPDRINSTDLPISLDGLSGHVSTDLSASFELEGADNQMVGATYDVSGKVSDFASSDKVMDRTLSDGQFDFSVNTDGYHISGPAKIDGLTANLDLSGKLGDDAAPAPDVILSAKVGPDDLKSFGFDASEFLTGTVQFTGKPLENGTIDVAIDLKDAGLTVADIGLSKARGEAGHLNANVGLDGDNVDITGIDLGFGNVLLKGGIKFDQKAGLQSADFTTFRLSKDDDAQVSIAPNDGGYALTIRGDQLDLKPLMQRFFSLNGGGSGSPTVESVDQPVTLDVKIDKALGFYATTAFNLNAQLSLRGTDLRNVNLQTQFGSGNGLSITTNNITGGRVLSVAFNDLGQLLRFTGTYAQLVGGNGSLVLTTKTAEHADYGEVSIKDFSIVDEANVAQVLGNHEDSRQLIARQNRIDIQSGEASFVRKPDRIEITDAVVDGGSVGGTAHGFIYTDEGQYDIVGTYIPLFKLNNAIQKLPLLGKLLGGRDGEGLIGVTFAVRGDLANPQFQVNPASLLVPGAFRRLFEFRAQERPETTTEGQ